MAVSFPNTFGCRMNSLNSLILTVYLLPQNWKSDFGDGLAAKTASSGFEASDLCLYAAYSLQMIFQRR
jgi:hypothetical protein